MTKKRIKLILLFTCCFVFILSLNTDATETLLSRIKSGAEPDYSACKATLTIVSDSGGGESRYGMPCYGHTFLVIKNTSDEPLDFCGRRIEPSEYLTLGWWAISSHGGIWFGIESNYIEAYGRYPDRVGLAREIDGEGLSRLADYIFTHDIYTPFENCALRAVAAFNNALSGKERLSCGAFVTPSKVVDIILAHGGCAEIADIDFTPAMPSCGFGDDIEYYSFAVKRRER